jgi:hypothetical protein
MRGKTKFKEEPVEELINNQSGVGGTPSYWTGAWLAIAICAPIAAVLSLL